MKLHKKAIVYQLITDMVILALVLSGILLFINTEQEDTGKTRAYTVRDSALKTSISFGLPGAYVGWYHLPLNHHLFKESNFHTFDFGMSNNFFEVSGKKFPIADNKFFVIHKFPLKEISTLALWSHGYDYELLEQDLKIRSLGDNEFKKSKYVVGKTFSERLDAEPIIIEFESADKFSEQRAASFINTYDKQLNLRNSIVPNSKIYIKLSSDNSSNVIAEIPYNSAEKSRKIAAIIINNFIESYENIDKAYIKIGPENNNAEAVVFLKIGNNLNIKLQVFNEIMYNSVGEYFKKWQ